MEKEPIINNDENQQKENSNNQLENKEVSNGKN